MEKRDFVVNATLLIKAPTHDEATNHAIYQLNKWFTEGMYEKAIEGYGYPDGTLLWYTVTGKERPGDVALATSSVVQQEPLADENPYPPIEFTHSG